MELIIHVRSIIGLSVQLIVLKYEFPYLTLWEDLEPVAWEEATE